MPLDEYGARSGRPRELGALDLVMLRKAVELNGATGIMLNMVDVLPIYSQATLQGIPYVDSYKIHGEETSDYPNTTWTLEEAHPVFKYFDHIEGEISKIRTYPDLPNRIKRIIEAIEDNTHTKIIAIGMGRGREDVIITPKKTSA